MIKKVGIYDPYLDTLGGGERYCLTIAEILLSNGYQIDIFWSGDKTLLKKAQERFNLKLEGVNMVPDIFNVHLNKIDFNDEPDNLSQLTSKPSEHLKPIIKIRNFYNKYILTKKYDLFFYLSDWSIPFIFSKNNFLHIQLPFIKNPPLSEKIFNSIKLRFFKSIICNSEFTQRFAINHFGNQCQVIYPPVDIEKFNPNQTKENIILSVGRFDTLLNTKKQEVLIEAFKTIYHQNNKTKWKLILAGGSLDVSDKNTYLKHLKFLSNGFPIEFSINPIFNELQQIYSKSKIYWHAAGFGVDQNLHPENTEHFGIAPVEAMASGLVPIVVSSGGLPEIVEENISGYLWQTTDELISKTQLLIASPDKLNQMAQKSIDRASIFSKENFSNKILSLINI